MPNTAIGKRMINNYEDRSRIKLTRRTPVILRLDGKSFHTLTRKSNCIKPYDMHLREMLDYVALGLCSEIQGAKCAYQQSDEISILLTDFDKLETDAWFDYNVQKIVSIAAGIASAQFSKFWYPDDQYSIAIFDARVFNVPKEEVCNYFVWRQRDWERNSIQMLARSHFSHKELQGKSCSDIHEMLHTKDINWAKLDNIWKRGVFTNKDENNDWDLNSAPIFKDERYIINDLIGYMGG